MHPSALQAVVLGLTFALLAWYFAGSYLNRRRASHLARAIAAAVPTLGKGATIRPLGTGSSGFQVEIREPVPELRSATLLCLLEARDFPLVWAYTRLRGRRDQILLQADLRRPPRQSRRLTRPLPDRGLPRLVLLETSPQSPHLRLSLGVGGGEEEQIPRAFALALEVARGAWPEGAPGKAQPDG
ncbi:MAG: hypothetical protein L6E13_08575 [Firmicutes bacterium]|nr:hypothetical protein [Bacillota bacterium]